MIPKRIAMKFTRGSDSECWIWTGALAHHGYGQVMYESKQQKAHRVLYQILVGPIPDGLTLDHLCRQRACVNPAHLEPVTMRENLLRGIGLTAVHAQKTHCINGHPLTGDNLQSRAQSAESRWRVCRACQKLYRDRHNARRLNGVAS